MNRIEKIKCVILLICAIVSSIAFLCVFYLKVSYPLGYYNEIRSACREFDIDESLVRAVINVESGYNELAVSKVGARGLMQIMPETAKWIAGELDIQNYNTNMLFDSDINIKMGAFYLKYLFDKYGEVNLVLFAYNAGEGRLNEILSEQDRLSVEDVTIHETRMYIKRVKKQNEVYKTLLKYDFKRLH